MTWLDEDDSSCSSGSCPARTETYSYNFSNTSSSFTNPDGGVTTNYFYDSYANNGESPFTGLVYKIVSPNGDVINRLWAANVPYGSGADTYAASPWGAVNLPSNPYLQAEISSFQDGTTWSSKEYLYDRNGNQVKFQEFDCLTSSCTLAASGISGGNQLRITNNAFVNPTGTSVGEAIASNYLSQSGSGATIQDSAGYWNSLSPQIVNLLSSSTVSGTANGSQTQFAYDCGSGLTHGNMTQEQDWDSGNNIWITISHTYDSTSPSTCVNNGYGNLTSTTNGRSIPTLYSYDSNNLYIQQEVSAYGTTDAWTFTYGHDFYTGALTSKTDTYHSITNSYGYDQYARLKYVNEGSVRSKSFEYYDQEREVIERTDGNCFGDHYDAANDPNDPNHLPSGSNCPGGLSRLPLIKTNWFDQLGRGRLTQNWAGSYVQTRYITPPNSGANYELQSNPYVTQSEPSMGWTLTSSDNVGRVSSVTNFSGSSLPSPWTSPGNSATTGTAQTTYNDNCSSSADEAAVSRTSCVDGLGRIKQVTENGTSSTWTYGYDALDNLTSVTPPMGSGRTFGYRSLKQLQWASNPETNPTGGQISYTYDANGNLLTRTDARSIVTTYCQSANSTTCYNKFDQPLYKTYSDSTPGVSYTYSKSWLTQEQAGPNSYNITGWDGIGRVTAASQTTNGQTYGFTVQYMPYIGVQSIAYPNSGRTVTTTYDSGGRPYSLAGLLSGSTTNYITGTTYQPHGAIAQQTLANGNLTVTRCVGTSCDNSRLQQTYLQVGNLLTLQYGYSSSQNNGNLLSQTMTRGSQSWTQSYGYTEAVSNWSNNRLACANETTGSAIPCGNSGASWTQTYNYDAAGNRWLVSAGPSNPTAELIMGSEGSSGPYDSSNRVAAWDSSNCWNGANCYDASGNLLVIPASGGPLRTAIYDAENRVSSTTAGGVTTTYVYDAEGRRVQKTLGSAPTVYVYDPLGNLAQEYGTAPQIGTMYLLKDHLGSTRLVTDGSGNAMKCYDYLPFGEEIANGTSGRGSCFGSNSYPTSTLDVIDTKFTSKERDAETGLDFFGARYMSSAQGRFTSADPGGGHLEDPQTLNRYAYARNNPLRFTDSTGLDFYLDCKGESDTCHNGNVGNWHNNEKGKLTFEQTRVQGDENGNNLTDQHGIAYEGNFDKNGFHFISGDKNYSGEFAAGTDPTTLKGAGLFDGFKGIFSSNGLDTNVAQGILIGTAKQFQDLINSKVLAGPNPGFDVLDSIFHPGTQYRGGNDTGPDPHLSYDPKLGGEQPLHFDRAYPYGDLIGFGEHSGSVLKYGLQRLFGTPAPTTPSIPPTLAVPH